jgi:RND family efflux transporter MFP subunit
MFFNKAYFPSSFQFSALMLVMLLALSACSDDSNKAASKPLIESNSTQVRIYNVAAELDTAALEQIVHREERQFHGIVKGINSYNETIFESGKIIQLNAKDGQSVKSGHLIAKLYSPILAEKLEQANAVLMKSQAELTLSQQTLTRNKILFDQKLISQQLLDEAKRDYQITKQVKNEAQAMVSQANNEFSDTAIKAKSNGIVAKFYKREGDFVSPGEAVFRFESTSKQKVSFSIPETTAIAIKLGESYQIQVPATGIELSATVIEKALPTEDDISLHTITFELNSSAPEVVGLRVILNYVGESILAYKVDYRAIRYGADNIPYIIKVAENLSHIPVSILAMNNQNILITAKLSVDSKILIGNEVSLPVNLYEF